MENENIELPNNLDSNYKNKKQIDKRKQEQREYLEDKQYQDGGRKNKFRNK